MKPGNALSEAYIYLGKQAVPIGANGAVDLGQFSFVRNGITGNTITYTTSVCPLATDTHTNTHTHTYTHAHTFNHSHTHQDLFYIYIYIYILRDADFFFFY